MEVEQLALGLDVADLGDVFEDDLVFGEDGGGHAGERGVFAPETLMVPSRGLPPRTTNLSIKGGDPRAGSGEAFERGQDGPRERSFEVDVTEALVAGGVEAAAEEKGRGYDDGQRAGDAGDLNEQRRNQQDQERP
jgi:hypothetical protein